MAATVTIRRWTGSSGSETKTDITSINTVANAQDVHEATVGTSSNPIKIPGAGNNYSYWVCTRLSVDLAPSGTIDNVRWHTDGANNFGTGVAAKATTASAYTQAAGTPGSTGDTLNVTNFTQINTTLLADAFTRTSGSPMAVTGSITTTGDLGHFVVYQLTIGTTANAGNTAQETFTWLYDET